MKNIIIGIFIFFSINAFSEKFPAKFVGDVKANGKQAIGAKVNVINNGDVILATSVKDFGFIISLEINAPYVIEISKPGFVTMKYSISTVVPESDSKVSFPEFDMGTLTLVEIVPNTDYSIYSSPIAKIKYNQAIKKFEYDQDYKKQFEAKLLALNNKADKVADSEKETADKIEEQKQTVTDNSENKEISTQKPANIVENKAKNNETKSLKENLSELNKLQNDDLEKAHLLKKIAKQQYIDNDLEKAKENLNEALKINQKFKDKSGSADVLKDLAAIEFDEGNFDKAIRNFDDAASLKLQTGDNEGAAYAYNDIALINNDLFRLDNALENFQLALELMKTEDNKPAVSNLLNNIGNIYYEKGDYNNALNYFNQSLALDQNLQNKENTAAALNNIGIAYQGIGNFDKAVESYEKSIDVNEALGNQKGVSVSLNNLGNITLEYYMQSLKIKEDIDYNKGLAFTLHNIGNVHKVMEHYKEALEYYTKSADLAKELSLLNLLQRNYDELSKIYFALNDCKNAYEYSIKLRDLGAFSDSDGKQLSEMIDRADVEGASKSGLISELKNEIERQKIMMQFKEQSQKLQLELKNQEIVEKDKDAKAQKNIIYLLVAGLILFLILLVIILKENRQKKKAKEKIQILFAEAMRSNEQIKGQQKEIVDSINYAKRIQSAILPTQEIFTNLFPEHFIVFKPRDIVSGDFYWMSEVENKKVIAVSDCTGHGVPGAFMSMLGIAFLKEIVTKEYMTNPGIILNRLRKEIVKSLQQNEKDSANKDGMDIVVCSIDNSTKMLEFAGANNSLIILRKLGASEIKQSHDENSARNDVELIELKGDKMPVGIYEKMDKFSVKEFQLQKSDVIYMFSDGFADQFGGDSNKKFKIKHFKKILLTICDKPMTEQQILLNQHFEHWKGKNDQIDDVTVLCIKIV